MTTGIPIKDTETIGRIKSLYETKGDFAGLLLFSLAINTGANLKNLLELNAGDIKGREYLIIDNKISVPLNGENKGLIQKILNGKKNTDPLFTVASGNRLTRNTVFRKFKEIRKELVLNSKITVASWRKTFGYHHYMKYKDLSFLLWYFNQSSVEAAMKYIDVQENITLRFREGVSL